MAKEKRSLFGRIFGREDSVVYGTQMQMLNSYSASFSSWNGSTFDDITARACIDAIARNAAKLSPKHIRQTGAKFEILRDGVWRLIAEQPNKFMNSYDFYYKTIAQLYLNNNAFIWIERDPLGIPRALYPLNANTCVIQEYKNEVYLNFQFSSGKQYTAPLDDVIHLKRFFCSEDLKGGSTIAIADTLSTLNTVKQGIVNAIKVSAGVKGIIKTTKALLKPEDVAKTRDQFVADFVLDNSLGIAALDAASDWIPVNINPMTATSEQMQDLNAEVLRYYGLSDKILTSSYTGDEWNAFYESTIEPIAIMMSQEFTNKLFSRGEKGFGNKIIFEAQKLQYAAARDKIEMVKTMNNYMTVNEIREIFNLAPVADGDKIMQDLNHIDASIANDYQGGDSNDKDDSEPDADEGNQDDDDRVQGS